MVTFIGFVGRDGMTLQEATPSEKIKLAAVEGQPGVFAPSPYASLTGVMTIKDLATKIGNIHPVPWKKEKDPEGKEIELSVHALGTYVAIMKCEAETAAHGSNGERIVQKRQWWSLVEAVGGKYLTGEGDGYWHHVAEVRFV